MKKYLIQALLIFLGNNLSAQYFNWARNAISSDNVYSYYLPPNILTDASGNIYSIGNYYGTVDFDPGQNTYNLSSYYDYPNTYSNLYILKLDAMGNFIWAKSFIGAGHFYSYTLALDSSQNVYATGLFDGKIDFNPGAAKFYLNSGNASIFITKLDKNGNSIWAKQMVCNDEIEINSITIDSKENVYTTGKFYGQLDVDPGPNTRYLMAYEEDMFISKLDTGGNFIWGHQIIGKNGYTRGMFLKTDSDDNLILTGQFAGVTDFDPSTNKYEMTSGAWDIFVMQLDKYGNFSWAKKMGGIGTEKPNSLDLDSVGNIYITGTFEQKADFDPSTNVANLTSNGGLDVFIVKLNESGKLLWANSIGDRKNEYSGSITVDKQGNVYVSGSFIDTVDFDPGSRKHTLISKPKLNEDGSEDIFILKLSSNGNFNWVQQYGESGTDRAISSIVDNNGNLITMGKFAEEVDFDADTGTYYLKATVKGYSTGFILRLSPCQLSTIAAIKGPAKVCSLSTQTYETDSIEGDFEWEVPTGASIQKGKNTHKIEVNFGYYSGDVSVRIKTSCGISKTKNYAVEVNPLPKVETHITPFSIVCEGEQVTLNGTGAVTYSWSGGISNGVSFKAKASGYYSVTGTDYNGCSNEGLAYLRVNPSPNFGIPVSDESVAVGSVATFMTQPSKPATTYQWQQNTGTGFYNLENFGQFSGTKTKTLQIKNISASQDNFGYRCIGQTGSCFDTTNIAKLLVSCVVVIESEPQNTLVDVGSVALFHTSSNNPIDKFQWQIKLGNEFINLNNSMLYSGVQSKTLTISNVTLAMDNSEYRCIISNETCHDTTKVAVLKTGCSLYFIDQPNDQNVTEGSEVSFTSVSAISNSKYQWQQNSGTGFVDLSSLGQYSGTTTETLKITNVISAQNNAGFRCIISETGCSDTSNIAILKVWKIGNTSFTHKNNFSIFPNPAENFITIQSIQVPQKISYTILDGTGRKILSGKLNKKSELVDISDLVPGIYLVRFNDESDVFKLIKH